MSDLENVVARAYQLRGKSRLSRTEFTFALAYELKWFTPEKARAVLDAAVERGLLREEGEKLVPAFSVKGVVIPADFKPGADVLEEKGLLDRILGLLEAAGTGRAAALELVENKRRRYDGLVTPEVAALIVASEKKLDIEPYVNEACREIVNKKQ